MHKFLYKLLPGTVVKSEHVLWCDLHNLQFLQEHPSALLWFFHGQQWLHKASPLILVSPLLFLTLFVSFSSPHLTFYILSKVHFHRLHATSLAQLRPDVGLWCSSLPCGCVPQGPTLQPLYPAIKTLPSTCSIKWHYKWHKISLNSYVFCSWFLPSRDRLRLCSGQMTASGALCDTC